MRRMLFACTVLVAVVAMGAPGWADEMPEDEKPQSKLDYEKFIGRDLVKHKRALNAELHRKLPLACPPFHLRDKDGEPIVKDDVVKPVLDENGNPTGETEVVGIPRPISTRETCGACHPYDRIVRGYHFQMGFDELYPPTPGDEGMSPHRGPGFYGKWQALYQRELAPWHFEDPAQVDLTPWEWVTSCGICHPGGGPAEFDRTGQRYDERLATEPSLTWMGNGDYHESPWTVTGVIEADCFICHLDHYEYSLRVQTMKKLNYEYAATAGTMLGYVWGSVKNAQQPKVYYDPDIFMADDKVALHIQMPEDRPCTWCHGMSSVQKRGSSWHSQYMQDVHTEQGIGCTDCHTNDIRHNFAKGSSSSQTVRQDLDGTMLSCEECHAQEAHGAPNETHQFLPPLHLERIDCTACHITHRPFLSALAVDSLTGETEELPNVIDEDAYDNYLFGAMWGKLTYYAKNNILDAFTPKELQAAADFVVPADDPMREYFRDAEGDAPLPEDAFTVRGFVEQEGGMASENARALMLLTLEKLMGSDHDTFYAVCVFRGTAYRFGEGWLKTFDSELQPRRVGPDIAETPFVFARSKPGDDKIYSEWYQLGVFWAYEDQGVGRPLHLKDMKAAWDFLHTPEYDYYLYPAEPANGKTSPAMVLPENLDDEDQVLQALNAAMRKKLAPYDRSERTTLEVHDDNNDTFPEANTKEEIALVAWALKASVPYLEDKTLYYVKGTQAYRVGTEPWVNPYEVPASEAPLVGENEPFIGIQRYEEREVLPEKSWEEPSMEWQPLDVRIGKAFSMDVQTINTEEAPGIAALAQRLPWTVSHGVEPAEKALGANGCTDCHAPDSHFFFGTAVVDPFTEDATPAAAPMYELLDYDKGALLVGAWRESVLKEWSVWLVLAVLVVILLHFAFLGSKPGTPPGKPNVLRFRLHERIAHLIAMVTVVFLAITGFLFLLGDNDPSGHFVRTLHTWFGYGAVAGTIAIFLVWVFYMFPQKGDLKWLMVAGGYLGGVKGHVPAHKFNAGQKLLFWLAVLAMGVLSVTGLMMGLLHDAHFANQELVYTIHDVAALVMILVLLAHIYLAGFVVPHSMRAIFGGKVSDIWAKEHHSEWKHPKPAE